MTHNFQVWSACEQEKTRSPGRAPDWKASQDLTKNSTDGRQDIRTTITQKPRAQEQLLNCTHAVSAIDCFFNVPGVPLPLHWRVLRVLSTPLFLPRLKGVWGTEHAPLHPFPIHTTLKSGWGCQWDSFIFWNPQWIMLQDSHWPGTYGGEAERAAASLGVSDTLRPGSILQVVLGLLPLWSKLSSSTCFYCWTRLKQRTTVPFTFLGKVSFSLRKSKTKQKTYLMVG